MGASTDDDTCVLLVGATADDVLTLFEEVQINALVDSVHANSYDDATSSSTLLSAPKPIGGGRFGPWRPAGPAVQYLSPEPPLPMPRWFSLPEDKSDAYVSSKVFAAGYPYDSFQGVSKRAKFFYRVRNGTTLFFICGG